MAQLTDIVGHIRLDCAIAAPNHYRRLLEQPPPARRTGIAIIGAGPATKALVTGLMRYFESVSVAYASTEAWIVCTKDYPATGPVPDVLPVGRPLPHVDLRIVDASGQDVPQGQQGIVRVRHPAQVAGYIGDPALTAEVFRDGWFQPGDLGYLNPDGELVVTGRIGEQLNVGGEKIAPAVIDEAILSVPGIRDAASFARPDAHGVDRLEAAIVVGGPDSSSATLSPATLSALAKHLRSRFEFIPERVYVLAEIPRTATGKVPRHQLPAAVAGAKAYSL